LHEGEASGAVVSVLLGAAEHNNGVQRLWKALRHDVPQAAETGRRRGVAPDGAPLAQVFRTLHAGHAGRLSFVRLWRGPLREGVALDGHRPGGIHRFTGGEAQKVPQAEAGDLVALGRLESVGTGTTLGGPTLPFPAPPPPVYALTIAPDDRKDEVRLSTALQRLAEEDPALTVSQDPESGATVLAGQGEIHLRTALDRLAAAGVKLRTGRAPIAFRETIPPRRRPARAAQAPDRGPRPIRRREDPGRAAPARLGLPLRREGRRRRRAEAFRPGRGPSGSGGDPEGSARPSRGGHLGDAARRRLPRRGQQRHGFCHRHTHGDGEALGKAEPVLLEPVEEVTVSVPAEFTPAAQRLLTGRRGQILGFAAKPGWENWDDVQALVPAAELAEFIIELRSQTQGLGSYVHRFDHLAEARGR
jgi:elongation factor G